MPRKLIGYARPGSGGPTIDDQVGQLDIVGCTPVFVEKAGPKALATRQRSQALKALTPEHSLVVTSLDRLGHSLVEITAVLQRIFDIGAEISVLDLDVDTGRDPAARHTLLAILAAQRNIVSERSRAGLAGRRAAGKAVGPPTRMKPEQWPELKAMIEAKESAAAMTGRFKVTRQTLWNFRQKMEAAEAADQTASSEKR